MSSKLAVNVPATRSTLVVLLKVLTQGEAVTEGCSPDQVTITMKLLLVVMFVNIVFVV